ncbi:MAG: DUF1343 domain-containing protein [Candidatus Tectomicrobia bacterium]|uniref:DUF1343 domain-containing protein n=1 Tax=Tectimicrobiota bacterium TaxID=2528274 RepID=A0A932CQJ6_UNCTE|nr:DUF1343 domain-containing protein [Candidatus Tectomicrobia bacterium]
MKTGLEVLLNKKRRLLWGQRVGLLINPTAIDPGYRHAIDLFHEARDFQLTTLFGPQHSIRGETQADMIEWEGYREKRTGLPAYSLYGKTRIPTEEMLQEVDLLVFDMQDVGTRVYTYIYTMAYAMRACAKYGRRMVVLDRPNPITGQHLEGSLLEPAFSSFVGLYPLPMRHGMTVGELARLFNERFGIGCQLEVVPMEGWKRGMWFDQTRLPWVIPSPNMPTLDTAIVYPGTVYFEGVNVSEGRGTTRPFELIGAPFIDPDALAAELARELLPGVHFRPHYFQPTFNKFVGEICGGVQIHLLDRERFLPVRTGIALLRTIHRLYPDHFQWKQPPYEYVHDRLPIDIIAGTNRLRQQIEADLPLQEIADSWQEELATFAEMRKTYLLY